MKTPSDMITGTTYKTSKCGLLVIDTYKTSREVLVTFKNTGFSTTALAGNIRKGTVTDKMARNTHGVGFIGVRKRVGRRDLIEKIAYSRWFDMIGRCYSERLISKNKTYKGCSVCEEWQEFHNFEVWFRLNYIHGYELDKDIKVDGNKIYSPETCFFVSKADNLLKAHARSFSITSPDGAVVSGYNVAEFCDSNGLSRSCVYNVLNGIKLSHKGWTKAEERCQ